MRTDRRRLALLLAALGAAIAVAAGLQLLERSRARASALTPERARELGVAPLPSGSLEVPSDYAPMLIEEVGTVRNLYVVDEEGRRVLASSRMDVARPQDLVVPYTQTMFASYLFRPRQERVLIVGLGGGSMVRFLEHHEPELEVDVVEIDPAVIEVAREYFGTRTSPTVRILARDGFEFLRTTPTVYDVVYMDAFLKPSEETDESGIPLRLKTLGFLRELQDRVVANGLVVFNVHEREDIPTIREAFAQTYVFRLAAPGWVVVGSKSPRRLPPDEIRRAALALDQRFQTNFSFAAMVERLQG